MKKTFILTAIAVLLAVASATAQQIAVVSEGGETTVYQTLQAAIEGAESGSVIYLPGGGFPISDEVKITKRLTIIGIGHKSNNDNVDGATSINGNLWFNEGSSGSSIMGCYITGTIKIGYDNSAVNNVLIKYCSFYSVDSKSNCLATIVNQCYSRYISYIRGANSRITNNVLQLRSSNSAVISNNIIIDSYGYNFVDVSYSYISCNVLVNSGNIRCGDGCQFDRNMLINREWGDNCINLPSGTTWEDVFVDYKGNTPLSNFHFKEAYQQYSDIGIYGGSGFNDHQTAPVPYIVAKRIAEETDAAGQLKIQVRVKASD